MFFHRLPILAIAFLPVPYPAQACPHRGYNTEALIEFLDNPNRDFNFDTAPKVNVWFSHTVGGVEGPLTPLTSPHIFEVDTGSCGVLMAASALEDWKDTEPSDPTTEEGFQFFTSSKNLYTGFWVERNVYFNRGTVDEVKAVLKILAVTKKTFCPDYKLGIDNNKCPYASARAVPHDQVRVMGIGFGRTGDGQPQGTPDKNALLNIQQIRHVPVTSSSLSYWPGWKITPAGLTVGLTEGNYDDSGFQEREAQLPGPSGGGGGGGGGTGSSPRHHFQWGELPGCVSIENVPNPCLECSVLLDTGVDQSYIRVPGRLRYPTHSEAGTSSQILDAAQRVDITFGRHRAASETFKVDDISNKVTPQVTYNYHDDFRFPFVNTGRHVFRAWEVAYDPLCGNLAFNEVV
ncbi:hypothetical protein KXX50_004918 [Aspergillus fumigatus]|nr:hypothetical protein KXX50_004918 [Aspergillus fumigatus]